MHNPGDQKKDLRSMTESETEELAKALGFPAYRGRQIFHWVHRHGAETFSEMSNLPESVRAILMDTCRIGIPAIRARRQSSDNMTVKLLLEMPDKECVETALMIYDREENRDRATCCVSTQSGCAMGCVFCATGLYGKGRNLTAGEIISQVLVLEKEPAGRNAEYSDGVTNIVFMGMGEPFMNTEEVLKSVAILNSPAGLKIGARRITISTCGIVPGIREITGLRIPCRLAVSLHAADDETRRRLMPIAKAYPLAELMRACDFYSEETKARVTFEYALFKGINDSLRDAERLARLLGDRNCFINIIPANPVIKTGFLPSDGETIDNFAQILVSRGLEVHIREPRGLDIDAACGQLRGR